MSPEAVALITLVAAHAAYTVFVSSVVLSAAASLSEKPPREAAAGLAADAMAAGVAVTTAAFAPQIERFVGAASSPGVLGHAKLFGALALALAACRLLPMVSGAAPSMLFLGTRAKGGLGGAALGEVLRAAWIAAGGTMLAVTTAAVSSGGGWRRVAAAVVLASAFAALELLTVLAARAVERDLLEYEPGEAVRPLERKELAARVRELCGSLGMPDAAERVMVDEADGGLNAFAMTRVVVLSKRVAELEDVELAAAVVAHELGHVRLRHVRKSTALDSALTASRFALLYAVLVMPGRWGGLAGALPLSSQARAAALLFFLVRPVVSEAAGLLALWYSRSSELSADAFGARAVGAEKYAEMLGRLKEGNPGLGRPYDALLAHRGTHPSLDRRIAAVLGREAGGAAR